MMKITIEVIHDPGHAWGKIPYNLLEELQITSFVSEYSYRTRQHAYLEEDCDLPLFDGAAKAAGYQIQYKEIGVNDFDSYLQSLPSVYRFPVPVKSF